MSRRNTSASPAGIPGDTKFIPGAAGLVIRIPRRSKTNSRAFTSIHGLRAMKKKLKDKSNPQKFYDVTCAFSRVNHHDLLYHLRFAGSERLRRMSLPHYLFTIQTILPIQYWILSLFRCNTGSKHKHPNTKYCPLLAFPSTNPDAKPANSREKIFNTLGFRALISLALNEDGTIKAGLFNKTHANYLIAFLETVYQKPTDHEVNEMLFQQALRQLRKPRRINMTIDERTDALKLTPIPLSKAMTVEILGEGAKVAYFSRSAGVTTAAESTGNTDLPQEAATSQTHTTTSATTAKPTRNTANAAEAASIPAHSAVNKTGGTVLANNSMGWVNIPSPSSVPNIILIRIVHTPGEPLVAITSSGTLFPIIGRQGLLYLPTTSGNLLVHPFGPNYLTPPLEVVQPSNSRYTIAATLPARREEEQSSAFRCISGPNALR